MKLIPRNDLENNVVAYYLKEEALAKALKRIQNRAAKGMLSKIGNILSAAGYKGADDPTVMLRPADPRTIRELERIADELPDIPRRNMLSKLYGQIGTGNLTVKRAIRDVLEFDTYSHSIELYDRSKDHLRRVTEEAMLRGEYAVQKGVGIGWQVDAPGLKEVDRFLDKRWTQNKATEFLKPMSQIVQDQVSQGLLLGEHPSKIAERIKNVEPISDVRAKRMARTTVTAVSNEAHAEQFEKHGIKRYEFRAMFNERTCIECGRLDGKVFNMADKQPGVNFPPIHPNCRCTTAAALSKEAKERLRETAIKNGHKLPLRDQMTFEEWKKQQEDAKAKAQKTDKPEKTEKPKSKKFEAKKTVNSIKGMDLVSKERKELAIKQMKEAPKVMQKAWDTNSSGLKIAEVKSKKGGYYSPSTHDVHINEDSDQRKGYWYNPETKQGEMRWSSYTPRTGSCITNWATP